MNSSFNEKNLCIWSQAKVIREIRCRKKFDCYECSLDKALVKISNSNKELKEKGQLPKGKKGEIVHWKEALLKLRPNHRPCIYSMKNKIPFRPCIGEYKCISCEFNQYFEDVYAVYAEIKHVNQMDIKGFIFPHGYYLSKYHTWVKIGDSSSAIIGMDHFVSKLFGPFSQLKPPVIGKRTKKGKKDILLKKGEKIGYLCSPINGIVLEVNPRVWQENFSPSDPYTDGWIMKVQSSSLIEDIKTLMFEEEVIDFLAKEVDEFYKEIERECGSLAADGGDLVPDIFTHIPTLDWDYFTKKFLRNR